jgi:2-polyprenyl-3-methyl-5-hydroxy-6-metoxy-1,4-benzoquinol methylase
MFNRNDTTYIILESTIEGILNDKMNPLNRICDLIEDGSRVLDIGAGNGLLSQLLTRKNKEIHIDGVEPNPIAAGIARPYYKNFFIGYIEDHSSEIPWGDYDYIVMADVVEHIADPTSLLQLISKNISPSAKLVLSIPNVSFGSVRISLMNGNFEYVDSGLLEKTHIRFYTLNTIKKLIKNVGMHTEQFVFLKRKVFGSEIPLKRNLKNLLLFLFFIGDETAFIYQYLIILSRNPESHQQ